MASVYRQRDRDGKRYPAWRFKFRNHTGKWSYGIGWPDRKKTLEHALALEAEHRAIRKGEKEVPPAWLQKRNVPIQGVIAEYLEWGKAQGGRRGFGWSERHLAWRGRAFKFWTKALSLQTLADIDLGRVEAEARKLLQKRTGKTAQGYVEAVKALCTWAVRHGYLKANPLTAMRGFDLRPKCPHRTLSDEEVRRLLEAAPPSRALAYRAALETGYRAGELRALCVRDFDMFKPSLRLPGQFTKNRRDAEQPITRKFARQMQELAKGREPEAPLLSMPKAETVSENFGRDCARARITRETDEGKATFHSLRVNYINAIVESGSDLKTIMTLARHGSAQMSMETYAKPKPERLRAAVEAVSEGVERAVSGEACCTYVARAVGAAGVGSASPESPDSCDAKKVVTPTGFEPVFRA